MTTKCQKPWGASSGKQESSSDWVWKKVRWKRCHCGLWHSNRFIPKEFWKQKWKKRGYVRQKAGVILIRDYNQVWVTQSYNRCYGFPKGEKELGESLETCAKREFYEETGMNIDDLDFSKFKQVRTFIENVEYVYFVIYVPVGFDIRTYPTDDVEITSFGWVCIRDIKRLTLSKAVKRILNIL